MDLGTQIGEKISNKLIAENAPLVALFPGSFSPPHKGHVEVVRRASLVADSVHIIISNNIREGYTPEVLLKVWNQYKKVLPQNVIISISESKSPITEIYNIVKDKSQNYLVVYGKGEQDRFNSINENREKYFNVDIIDAGNYENLSATSLREAIAKRNRLAIKSLIPEGITVNEFLLNFQLHEVKVNNPNNIEFPITLNDINDWYKIKEKIELLGYKWLYGETPELYDFPSKIILYKKSNKLLAITDLNEVKVNNPTIKFPLHIKDLQNGIRYFNILEKDGYTWFDGSLINDTETIWNDKKWYPIVLLLEPGYEKRFWAQPEEDMNEVKVNNPSKPLLFKSPNKLDEDLYEGELYFQNERISNNVIYLGKNNPMGVPESMSLPTSEVSKEIKHYTKEITSLMSSVDLSKVKLDLNEEKIPGGLSSGMTLDDLAKKHSTTKSKLSSQLFKGIKVEMEHTTSRAVAKEIAMDHIYEDPKYYDKLASIEEIKVNKPGIIPYQDFEDLIHSVKNQVEFSDILEKFGYDMMTDNIPRFYERIKETNTLPQLINIANGMEKRTPAHIDEAKNYGDLYHFTSYNGLQGILYDNVFKSSKTEVDKYSPDFRSFRKKESDYKDKGIEDVNYFSMTRNKDLWKKDPKVTGSLARITIDGNKLSQNFKIQPFSYYGNVINTKTTNNSHLDEAEERVNLGTKTEIPNAQNYIKEIVVFLDKVGDNTRVLKIIQHLQEKYPQIKSQYKGKEINVEQYISDILPNIEPYNDVEEVIKESLKQTLGEIKVNKPNVPIIGKEYLVDEFGTDDWVKGKYMGRFQKELPSGPWDYAHFLSPNYESHVIDWDKIQGRIKKSTPEGLKEVFQKQHAPILDKAVKYAMEYLDVPKPNIILINNPEYTKEYSSFGGYSPHDKSIRVVTNNRNLADITRSMFHEMVHLKQDLEDRLELGAGKDGDEWENEANSTAGTMMRKFSRENKEIFE